MEWRSGEVLLHYSEYGDGVPLVALHGAGVDHRDIEAALEASLEGMTGAAPYRRIYPDLPGMGHSSAEGLDSNDDVVDLLIEFIEHVAGGPALLVGHSYGGYLARGVAARQPDAVLGLALICPIGETTRDVPAQVAVRQDDDAYDELDPSDHDGFDGYFVVRTAANARRYRDQVVPGTRLVDESAFGRIAAAWAIDLGGTGFDGPTLIVAGRQDSVVGFSDAMALQASYPHATLAVVDGAGHALPHERPELLGALLADWARH